jgi:hypothetical protein
VSYQLHSGDVESFPTNVEGSYRKAHPELLTESNGHRQSNENGAGHEPAPDQKS